MKRVTLSPGDVIEAPLMNSNKSFIQYLGADKWGDLVRVFDFIINQSDKININDLKSKQILFGPVLTRMKMGMKLSEYGWKKIGSIAVTDYIKPKFIWKDGGSLSRGKTTKWFLYDGVDSVEIGSHLPSEYASLEYMTSYSPGSLVKRIVTEINPDQELILER